MALIWLFALSVALSAAGAEEGAASSTDDVFSRILADPSMFDSEGIPTELFFATIDALPESQVHPVSVTPVDFVAPEHIERERRSPDCPSALCDVTLPYLLDGVCVALVVGDPDVDRALYCPAFSDWTAGDESEYVLMLPEYNAGRMERSEADVMEERIAARRAFFKTAGEDHRRLFFEIAGMLAWKDDDQRQRSDASITDYGDRCYGGPGGNWKPCYYCQGRKIPMSIRVRHGAWIDRLYVTYRVMNSSQSWRYSGFAYGGGQGGVDSGTITLPSCIDTVVVRSGSYVDYLEFLGKNGEKVGPFGGNGGTKRINKASNPDHCLTEIKIYAGAYVDKVCFKWGQNYFG